MKRDLAIVSLRIQTLIRLVSSEASLDNGEFEYGMDLTQV
jgi:hypothetical protein